MLGYTVTPPAGWYPSGNHQPFAQCEAFDRRPMTAEVNDQTAAETPIVFRSLGPIPDIAHPVYPGPTCCLIQVNDRMVGEPSTVAGRLATRWEQTIVAAEGPFRSGARSYTYLVDLGRTVLAAQYYAPPGEPARQYNAGKHALDELVSSLEIGSPGCVNSSDHRCGAFYWAVDPADNQPLQVTLPPQPVEAALGQPVTFDVTATDPDADHVEITAQFEQWACIIDPAAVGFGDLLMLVRMKASATTGPFGPWQPPSRVPGHSTSTVTHTFAEVGEHVVHVSVRSTNAASPLGQDPYGSYDGCLEIKVAVR